MLTLASPSVRASSPSVPGRSWMSMTSTSRSSATPRRAARSACSARSASSSSKSRWITPRPSPVKAASPWMLTPARPVASPSAASWPGSFLRITVRSLGTLPRTLHRGAHPRLDRRTGDEAEVLAQARTDQLGRLAGGQIGGQRQRPGQPGALHDRRSGVHGLDFLGVLAVDRLALELHRRRQLVAARLPVARDDVELLDLFDPRELGVGRVDALL